jgi:hypothetical protein
VGAAPEARRPNPRGTATQSHTRRRPRAVSLWSRRSQRSVACSRGVWRASRTRTSENMLPQAGGGARLRLGSQMSQRSPLGEKALGEKALGEKALGEKALGETALGGAACSQAGRSSLTAGSAPQPTPRRRSCRRGGPSRAVLLVVHSSSTSTEPSAHATAKVGGGGSANPAAMPRLQSKRLLIESQWVSKPLAFAGKMRPRRLNN